MDNNFVERLKTEQADLIEKINKLKNFLSTDVFKNLTVDNRELLIIQLEIMEAYSRVLSRRIQINDKE